MGVKHKLPTIEGIDKFWPHNIFWCPYCSAPSLKNQPLAVLSAEEEAFDLVQIISKWTNDFILLTNGTYVLTDKQLQKSHDKGVKVINQKISHFSGQPQYCINTHFSNGDSLERRGIFIHMKHQPNSMTLIKKLALEVNSDNLLVTNDFFQSTHPGVYAVGDLANRIQKISTAISSGTIAAFAIDHALSQAL